LLFGSPMGLVSQQSEKTDRVARAIGEVLVDAIVGKGFSVSRVRRRPEGFALSFLAGRELPSLTHLGR
jgi:hypothetical protein